jgi:teichuronic acid biosynthesis glycosyltransferase TuaH
MKTVNDYIILALPRWDAMYSSGTYAMAKELAKNSRVFYIDHPYTMKDFFTQRACPEIKRRRIALVTGKNIYTKITGLPEGFTAVTPRLVFPINALPDGAAYDMLSRMNDRIVFRAVRQIVNDFKLTNFVFLNSYDPYYGRYFPAAFRPAVSVYKSSDDISQARYTARHGIRLEREAIRRADLTIATSKELTKIHSMAAGNVHYLPNAADIHLFRKAFDEKLARPAELISVTTKIIGYIGALSTRLDYSLIKKTALHHADKTLVLVGSKDNSAYRSVGLEELPNVLFTGPKRIDDLPAYVKSFDCAIIPFERTALTRSIYPLKLNEYLAGGIPVVTTDFADLGEFRSVISIAGSDDQFLSMIDREIRADSPEKRQKRVQIAESNSWEARAETFRRLVSLSLESKHGKTSLTPSLERASS